MIEWQKLFEFGVGPAGGDALKGSGEPSERIGVGTLLGHGYTVDRFYRRKSRTPSSFHIHSKL